MQRDEYGLSQEDMADIVEYFDAYSLRDLPAGTVREDLPVSADCLEVLLADMGFLVTEAELTELQKKLDPQCKGHICLPTFVEEAAGPLFARTRLTEENAELVFGMFDSDGDGLFGTGDIGDVLALFGERPSDTFLADMVAEVDMDGDRAVGMDEFKYFAAGEVF